MIIAVVGAGGKTTWVHELAKRYQRMGKRVLITTTTHIMQEDGCVLSEDAATILRKLDEEGICMAGNAVTDGKIGAFSDAFFDEIQEKADVVIVEADGSKHLPLKAPLEHEPVIPKGCDRIEVVMGIHAIGKPLGDVTHRLERVMELTGLSEDHIVTSEDIQNILRLGYLEPLKKKYPQCEIRVHLGQVSMPNEKTDLILLAAGDSRRYGADNKLLVLVDGKPMFTHAVDMAIQVKREIPDMVGRIVVVSKYKEIEDYIKTCRHQRNVYDYGEFEADWISYQKNAHSERGISESIHIGIDAAKQEHAALFLVCDQPWIKAETVRQLILTFAMKSWESRIVNTDDIEKKAGILMDEDGNPGNPCIFAPCMKKQLQLLTGDQGGRKVIRGLSPDECLYVRAEKSELRDIDAME